MRDITNWQVYAQGSQPPMYFGGRGYTGHEHLNGFGLINMNARLYDPMLARFLAPDPFVGSGMTNDFNRYIYGRNNPMMYTDPSGKFVWLALLAGYAAYTAISYLAGVRDHKGEMDPTKWKETTFVLGYSSNTGGYAGFSFDGGSHSSNFGYNLQNNSFNMSATQNGVTQGGNPFYKPYNPEQYVVQREQEIRQEQAVYSDYADYWESTISNYASFLSKAVPSTITLSLNVDASLIGRGGIGVRPVNITLLTRGVDAGLYYTPGGNLHYGSLKESVSATVGITYSWYLGDDSQNIRSYMLEGHYSGLSYGAGDLLYGGGNIGYSPYTKESGFYSFGAQGGIGYGGGISLDYQYTAAPITLFKFNK